MRVLVVDDNSDVAETLRAFLALFGHEVTAVSDAATAVETATELGVQAAVLDIRMPGVDGYELARRLRREPSLVGITLMAVTGTPGVEDSPEAALAGFDKIFVKPVSPYAILDVLGRPSSPADSERRGVESQPMAIRFARREL